MCMIFFVLLNLDVLLLINCKNDHVLDFIWLKAVVNILLLEYRDFCIDNTTTPCFFSKVCRQIGTNIAF